MALQLKRIIEPYFCVKCDITRKLLAYGDYYYEDDEDGLVVCANYLYDRKMQEKYELAMQNPEIAHAHDSIAYQTQMRAMERQFLDRGLLERPIAGKKYAPKGGGSPNA